ncbi:hypothetical protein OIA45_49110 (plasmid) [Streptomyces chartreusis]|uniref:hypothetical protein n=1 Tax=Streptomyces chartreusis TaxID=1969 RepID=UPI0038635A9F|nr:hypothetical protein OIA45_49110 [Streptomyces chartreusis]
MSTAPARPTLYGPDGQALARTPEPSPQVDSGDWKPVRQDSGATVWERPRLEAAPAPDPVVDDAREQAEQIVAEARTEAERITAEARSLRARTLGSADHEARSIRETAAAEVAGREKRGRKLDTLAGRAVITGAVGLTAFGEYSLARLAHFPASVAWLLPFVIDVYVIQAFRRHRDIVPAISLTVAANVVYHLAAAGMFGVTTDSHGDRHATWWLIAMVSSIASIILWRMHVMTAPPKVKKRRRVEGVESTLTDVESSSQQQTPETVASAGQSTDESSRESASESPSESSRESSRESTQTASHRPPRESSSSRSHRRTPRRRESARKVSAIGTPESEVDALVTLMQQRGSADAVTLTDAKRIAAGRSEATAARRLQTARAQYAK